MSTQGLVQLAQAHIEQGGFPWLLVLVVAQVLIVFSGAVFLITRYKRCPSNRLLVIYGRTGGDAAARVVHGGGAFVFPLIQDYMLLSLIPHKVDVDVSDVLPGMPAGGLAFAVTTVIGTETKLAMNAATHLLSLRQEQIDELVHGVVRDATRTTARRFREEQGEVDWAGEAFETDVREAINAGLVKIGMEVVSFDIRFGQATSTPEPKPSPPSSPPSSSQTGDVPLPELPPNVTSSS